MHIYKIHSEVLDAEASVFITNFKGKTVKAVKTADGVEYNNNELEILVRSRKPLPKEVHILKKEFAGTLIYHEMKLWKRDGSN